MSNSLPFSTFPGHWGSERLDRLFRVVKENAHLEDEPVSAFIDGVVTLRSNRPEAIIKGSGQEIGYKHLEKGDLVISGMNAHLGGLGISDSSGKCTPVYTILRKTTELDERYISYYLWHAAKSGYIKSLVNAVRYNSADFGPETIKNFMVLVPPIDEQRNIAEFLDNQVNLLNELISKTENQIESVAKATQSRLSEIFLKESDEMIPLKRLIKDERLGIWGEEVGVAPFEVIVGRVADFNRNSFTLDEVKTLRSIEIKQFLSRKVNFGDILLERSGGGEKSPVGCAVQVNVSLPNLVCSNFVSRIRAVDGVDAGYLSLVLAALYSNGLQTPHSSQTTGIQNLDTESYFQQLIPKISQSEQVELAALGKEIIKHKTLIIGSLEKFISLAEELKSSLISSAVTGQVDISNKRSVA